MIRVFLVDDHPLVREGVSAVLASEHDVSVVGEAASAEQALTAVARTEPDVVLVDIRLPGMDGIDACQILRERHPAVKVIVVTGYRNGNLMIRAFDAGAKGFLIKESPADMLRQAVHVVAAGGTFVDPQVAGKLVAVATRGRRGRGPYGLTAQEMRVLELLPKGLNNREIGNELGLSPETVKTHLRHAMRKLQATDRTQAAAIVMREGWT